jgi:hypothetical protein
VSTADKTASTAVPVTENLSADNASAPPDQIIRDDAVSRRWLIGDIKSTALRRVVLATAFPVICVVRSPAYLLLPFIVAWRCLCAAWDGAIYEMRDNLSDEDVLLLRRGYAWLWHAKYHTDRAAALADVKARVR